MAAKQVVFHIDVNSAFLSWEAVHRLIQDMDAVDLRTIPSIIGGDMSKRRGVVLAKSIPAKQYGIRTGEPIVDALRKYPNLLVVPANHELYETMSKAFIEIISEYTPCVEQVSIDEAFMDMSGMERLYPDLVKTANDIRDRILAELKFTVNIGIAPNKLLAKMASDFQKPNQVHTLFLEEIERKMWPLPVSELFFVGKAASKKLSDLGIKTIGELARADKTILYYHLKKQGEVIWNFANGIDVSVVEPLPPLLKGYGNSTTIAFDVTDAATAKMVLLSLTENVGTRLRADHVRAGMLSVNIKDFRFVQSSHQMMLPIPTDITKELHQFACRLFDELWDGTPIRLLGIQAGKITDDGAARQLSLFDDNYEKYAKLDEAVDTIRNKYGLNAIKRASFLENKPRK